MQQPGAWIVCFESDDEVATCWEKRDVSSGWVVKFHVDQTVPVWGFGLGEDCEVVAVKVNLRWVRR